MRRYPSTKTLDDTLELTRIRVIDRLVTAANYGVTYVRAEGLLVPPRIDQRNT